MITTTHESGAIKKTAQNALNCQTTCNDVQSLCDANYQSNNNLQFTKLIAFSKKNTNHGRKLPGS